MLGLLSLLGQATPMTPTEVIALGAAAAGDVIDSVQVTYVVMAAVGVSFGLWFIRRSLKLGR